MIDGQINNILIVVELEEKVKVGGQIFFVEYVEVFKVEKKQIELEKKFFIWVQFRVDKEKIVQKKVVKIKNYELEV